MKTYDHTHTHTYTHTYIPPHNRNIWPSPTPTANQYKHMAQRRIIETYGHTIARRRSFVCASADSFVLIVPVYPLLLALSNPGRGERFCPGSGVIYGNL